MNIDKIIGDARDPSSIDNTFRMLWADYQAVAFHIKAKGIFGYPLKALELDLKGIQTCIHNIRYGDPAGVQKEAELCFDLVMKCRKALEALSQL